MTEVSANLDFYYQYNNEKLKPKLSLEGNDQI